MSDQEQLAQTSTDSDPAWDLALKVRADLDRSSCPNAFMEIAVESIVRHAQELIIKNQPNADQ